MKAGVGVGRVISYQSYLARRLSSSNPQPFTLHPTLREAAKVSNTFHPQPTFPQVKIVSSGVSCTNSALASHNSTAFASS